MPLFDLGQDELQTYRSSAVVPDDIEEFWTTTLAEARGLSGPPRVRPEENGLQLVSTDDVTFSGFGGQPVRAWLQRPAGAVGDLPVVVRFQGYGGGRGLSHRVPPLVLAGPAASTTRRTTTTGGSSPTGCGPSRLHGCCPESIPTGLSLPAPARGAGSPWR